MSNKNTPEEMIACIQAWQRGEKIEVSAFDGGGKWTEVSDPVWNFGPYFYRIAPKPTEKKLRPWKPE